MQLIGCVTLDSNTIHLPDGGPVICNCVVLRSTIIPECHRIFSPLETTLYIGIRRCEEKRSE